MSWKKIAIIYAFIFSSLFAQKYTIGINYSGLNVNNNLNFISEFSLEGNYLFPQNKLSVGIISSIISAQHEHLVIGAAAVNEISFGLALNAKYHPFTYSITASKYIQPFLGTGIGNFLSNTFSISGNLKSCDQHFSFSVNNYFYSYLSVGGILGSDLFQFIIEAKYQIRKPEINYDKPNCINGNYDEKNQYTKLSKTANLNILILGIGINIFF